MTSTPVSLNDESLNGSWIDINSASQIHSPVDNDSPERLRPPYSLAESAQSLGLLSFQVERFLQEAQKSTATTQGGQQMSTDGQQPPYLNVDNISDICFSDSDTSVNDGQQSEEGTNIKPFIDSLREHHNKSKHRHHHHHYNHRNNTTSENLQDYQMSSPDTQRTTTSHRLSKSGDCLIDQLSDSLSLLSRASLFGETTTTQHKGGGNVQGLDQQDFDWLWDWTAQPEYFAGQEWKVNGAPKVNQDYLMKQKQIYSANGHNGRFFSSDIMSLLFLTNILSIIIGAGITYSILMRRSSI